MIRLVYLADPAAAAATADLEVLNGLVVPRGTRVAVAVGAAGTTVSDIGAAVVDVKIPDLPEWPTAEASLASYKRLLGIRRKKAAKADDDEAAEGPDGVVAPAAKKRGAAAAAAAAAADMSDESDDDDDSSAWSEGSDDDDGAAASDEDA